MAGLNPDAEEETGPIYDDIELESELRAALKTEPEIELFKVINRAMRVKDELANNEVVKVMLQDMWRNVAEFFDAITDANTLVGLTENSPIVVSHKDMQANFRAVAAVNMIFKEADNAEEQLIASDQMQREQEETEI